MGRHPIIASLWTEAFQEVSRENVTKLGVTGAALRELTAAITGDDLQFRAAVQQRDLASLGSPPADTKHNRTLNELFQIIYQHTAALDQQPPSRLADSFAWDLCRVLFQFSYEIPAFAIKTKEPLKKLLSLVDQSRDELSLYIGDLKVKRFIKTLCKEIIILSALAKTYARQRERKENCTTSASSALHRYLGRLQHSIGLVSRALTSAANAHDDVLRRQPPSSKQWKPDRYSFSSMKLSDDSQAHLGDKFIQNDNSVKMVINPKQSSSGEPSLFCWLRIDSIPVCQPSPPVPGTCTWLLRTSQWQSWTRKATPYPFVLTGPQGSGKSTLAQFVRHQLKTTSSEPVLSYFFAATQGQKSCTAQAFLITILGQLYRSRLDSSQRTAFNTIFKNQRTYHRNIWECPYPKLLKLVEQILNRCPSYYLIVDSLDENVEGKGSLYDFLMKLGSREGVAVMITCRIDATPAVPSCRLNLQSHSNPLHADLTAFVEHEVNNKMQLQDPRWLDFKKEVVATVASSATFLHAKLLIEILRQQTIPGEIRDIMNSFVRKQSEDLYEQLLRDSEKRLSEFPKQLARQKWILQLMVAAQETLSLDQVAAFLALDPVTAAFSEDHLSLNIRQEVEELCGSFVSISPSGTATFCHTTARTFFESHPSTSADKSNLYLALKCLAVLSQDKFKDPEKATELLCHHLMPSENSEESASPSTCSSIYRYAALYVHDHISAVVNPPQELLSRLNRFLQGFEFVTWSESVLDFRAGASYATQIDFRASLSSWIRTLPPADQVDIKFEQFFEAPHVRLSEVLKDAVENKVLQFLPRIRLGDFFNAAAQSMSDLQKGYIQKQIVYDGLSVILPREDHFLLQARTGLLQEYFWQKRFAEVLPELQDLYKLQKQIGRSGNDIFTTAWLIGFAWIALNDYTQAETILMKTLEQVRQLRGERDRFFNMLLLLDGQRLERVNDLKKAAATYDAALSTMTEVAGPQNIFVLTLKIALGATRRKQGLYEEAETLLFEGWAGRRKVNNINLNACFDGALQLAILYRDKGDGAECRQLLDAIKDSAVLQDDFERYCQFVHINSLVAFDEGEYTAPKYTLMKLIDSASGKDRAKNNRELLWIRIDLADAMRAHDESDEALMLFSELVIPSESTELTEIHQEPESPVQLAIAERALRLIRIAQFADSERLLRKNNLCWLREADFYFSIQGGPTLDTSIIHPIRIPRMGSVRLRSAS